MPAKREVRSQHAQSRDAALSGNSRPFYLCSVGGWKLLQEEYALGCHCLAQSFAGGYPTGGVTSAGRPRQPLVDDQLEAERALHPSQLGSESFLEGELECCVSLSATW